MKRNWFWWFERSWAFVAGLLGFVTYRLIDHGSAFLIWALAGFVVEVTFRPRKPKPLRPKPARQAYAEYLQREQPKKEQKWFNALAAGAKAGYLELQRLKKEQKRQKL